MSAAYSLPVTAPAAGKSATFGTTSVVFAGLTILLPVAIMIYFGAKATEADEPEKPLIPLLLILAGGVFSLMVAGVTSVVGALAGGVALARREGKTWLAVIGLLVNVPVALFALYVFAVTQMSGGQ